MRQHLLVVPKADDMQSVNRCDVAVEHSLDMSPRIGLLSEQMQREADHAIADENIPGVGRPRSNLLEPLCKGQNFAQVSIGEANGPQPRNRAQLIVGIVKVFGNCQDIGPCRLDLGARTPEETAVAIAAELIQLRWGGSGQPLTLTEGRIHHNSAREPADSPTA